MSEPRVRVVEGGVEIDVPNDHPRGALVLESARHSFVRIALDAQTLVWARVHPQLAGIAWARAEREPLRVIAPIRAAEARTVTDWPAWFGAAVVRSDRCWLRPGTWGLSTLAHVAGLHVVVDTDEIAPDTRALDAALDLPASFLERYRLDGSGRVIPLRTASRPDAARVKSWRKHAREATLPPILVGWVSALDVYVVLDGHDRLLAARLEKTKPEAVGLYTVQERRAHWADEARDQSRATALERYERVFTHEVRISELSRREANRDLVGAWSDHRWRYAGTTARYGGDLATRFRDELASRALPDDVRAALLR
jgi:hypothetical protein